jgi:hypothetical protein
MTKPDPPKGEANDAQRQEACAGERFLVSLVLFGTACLGTLLTYLLWAVCENECNTDEQLPF